MACLRPLVFVLLANGVLHTVMPAIAGMTNRFALKIALRFADPSKKAELSKNFALD